MVILLRLAYSASAPHSLERDTNLLRGTLPLGRKEQDIPPGHVDASTGKTIYTRARGNPQGGTEMALTGIRLRPESPQKKQHLFTVPEAPQTLPVVFASPPLSSRLLQSILDMLDPTVRPSPIHVPSLNTCSLHRRPPSCSHRLTNWRVSWRATVW